MPLNEAFRVAKSLVDLSHEDKMKAPHPAAVVPHSGYSSVWRESEVYWRRISRPNKTCICTMQILILFKSYDICSEERKIDYYAWLPEEVLPGFRTFTAQYSGSSTSCVIGCLMR